VGSACDTVPFGRFFLKDGGLGCWGAEVKKADSSSCVRWYVREMKRKWVKVYGSLWKVGR